MESKIKIRIGAVEVEYEGSESFLKNDLSKFIKMVLEISDRSSLNISVSQERNEEIIVPEKSIIPQLSTNSIAAKISVKSGPDLAVAAAAHLTFIKGHDVFSRQDLLNEMKTASSYFKDTYRKNLTHTLRNLIKTKFNEPSSGKYTLTAETKKSLRSILA